MVCSVRRLGPDAWAVEGAELGWLRCLVKELFEAGHDAAALREHPLDAHVLLTAAAAAVPAAAAKVLLRLEAVARLDHVRCDGRRGVVRVHGEPPWDYGNLVRRALLSRVPVLACTSVAVARNDSTAPSEAVAHRLGQVALRASARGLATPLRGALVVEGRSARGSDLQLPEGVALVEDFELVPLQLGQRFEAELVFEFGVGHAKHDAVASPEYVPELRLEGDAGREALRTAGYDVDEGGHVSHPKLRVRPERLRELAPSARLGAPRYVDVVFETLGQWSAAECLELALEAVRAELRDLVAAVAS